MTGNPGSMRTRLVLPLVLAGVVAIAGCAANMSASRWQGNPTRDSYECSREAQWAGNALIDASPLWRRMLGYTWTGELYEECMEARGFQRKESENK